MVFSSWRDDIFVLDENRARRREYRTRSTSKYTIRFRSPNHSWILLKTARVRTLVCTVDNFYRRLHQCAGYVARAKRNVRLGIQNINGVLFLSRSDTDRDSDLCTGVTTCLISVLFKRSFGRNRDALCGIRNARVFRCLRKSGVGSDKIHDGKYFKRRVKYNNTSVVYLALNLCRLCTTRYGK